MMVKEVDMKGSADDYEAQQQGLQFGANSICSARDLLPRHQSSSNHGEALEKFTGFWI